MSFGARGALSAWTDDVVDNILVMFRMLFDGDLRFGHAFRNLFAFCAKMDDKIGDLLEKEILNGPPYLFQVDETLKKKRAFRKFTYRGVDLDQLLDMPK